MATIQCFGISKEIVKSTTLELSLQTVNTVAGLRILLEDKYPEFKSIAGYMIAINQEYGLDNTKVNDADEIAIIPPVSGG